MARQSASPWSICGSVSRQASKPARSLCARKPHQPTLEVSLYRMAGEQAFVGLPRRGVTPRSATGSCPQGEFELSSRNLALWFASRDGNLLIRNE